MRFEPLEDRHLLAAMPVITELMADNGSTLLDAAGRSSDWIEIHNAGDAAIDLAGWSLTDDPDDLARWTFPDVEASELDAGEYLVVFASGDGVPDAAGNLHTNFGLANGGEFLALVRADGTVASRIPEVGDEYPSQRNDVSFGRGEWVAETPLIDATNAAVADVPTADPLGTAWTGVAFEDAGWQTGTLGVGFDTGGFEDVALPPDLIAHWTADDLAGQLADGATVATWTDAEAGAQAHVSLGSPTLQTGELNGHAVVRFDPADGDDQLRVAP